MALLASQATGLRELQLPFGPPKAAAATFRDLADAAERHGIDLPDVYGACRPGSAPWLADFEARMASKLGKEAALWVPSGTMAQQIVLCAAQKIKLGAARTPALPRERRAFFAHPTSHLLLWEQEAHQRLLDMPCIQIGERSKPLVSGDLREALNAAMDLSSRPAAVVVEVPHRELGGTATPFEELQELRRLCDEQGVWLHMDGARLFEILPYYRETHGVECREISALFDSVYVSFYKGLGGMSGAMLCGSSDLVAEARVWLRRFGGNIYTCLPYAVSALDAFDRQEGSFEARWQTMRTFAAAVNAAAVEAASAAEGRGAEDLVRFNPPTPQCCQVHCHIRGSQSAIEAARDQAASETGTEIFKRLRGESPEFGPEWQYFEWAVGPVNAQFSAEEVQAAWAHFFKCIGN